MQIEYRITTHGTCESLEAIPKGAQVEAIDDREFIAFCEACGNPILSENAGKGIPADDYQYTEDGVYLCRPCINELMDENNSPKYVTREMALDAGDPRLEGTEY